MTLANLINATEILAELARKAPANHSHDLAGLAVIEQMFGYFSFAEMPLEALDLSKHDLPAAA